MGNGRNLRHIWRQINRNANKRNTRKCIIKNDILFSSSETMRCRSEWILNIQKLKIWWNDRIFDYASNNNWLWIFNQKSRRNRNSLEKRDRHFSSIFRNITRTLYFIYFDFFLSAFKFCNENLQKTKFNNHNSFNSVLDLIFLFLVETKVENVWREVEIWLIFSDENEIINIR